jgi:hypothetical protein
VLGVFSWPWATAAISNPANDRSKLDFFMAILTTFELRDQAEMAQCLPGAWAVII